MSNLLALSPNDCKGKSWLPPANLTFAAERELIPLHAGELARAAGSMPLAVVKSGSDWQLVGVCGQAAGHNLFIKAGEWLGSYVPEWLSCYPFDIYIVGESGIVTFDRDSGLEAVGESGQPFFTADGSLAAETAKRVEVLKASHGKNQATKTAVEALASAGVFTPWPEQLAEQLGIQIEGLHMIDERKLAELDDSKFLALRKALPVAYALNFSVSQAHLLARLARINPAPVGAPVDLDEVFGEDDDGNISFGF